MDGGVAAYARAVEEAMEEYDVRHAHVDSRANIAHARAPHSNPSFVSTRNSGWLSIASSPRCRG